MYTHFAFMEMSISSGHFSSSTVVGSTVGTTQDLLFRADHHSAEIILGENRFSFLP